MTRPIASAAAPASTYTRKSSRTLRRGRPSLGHPGNSARAGEGLVVEHFDGHRPAGVDLHVPQVRRHVPRVRLPRLEFRRRRLSYLEARLRPRARLPRLGFSSAVVEIAHQLPRPSLGLPRRQHSLRRVFLGWRRRPGRRQPGRRAQAT